MTTTARRRWRTISERYSANADLVLVDRETHVLDADAAVRLTVNDARHHDDAMAYLTAEEAVDLAVALLSAAGPSVAPEVRRLRGALVRVTADHSEDDDHQRAPRRSLDAFSNVLSPREEQARWGE